MITAKYTLENEAGERIDLTAPANIFLVNVEGLGITTNVTYGDLENGFFHTLYEQTPQNNITGDLIYQTTAFDNYQTLVNWISKAKTIYFCYQPLETEYRRIVKLNYIVKERRTAGGWMRAGISFSPLTPWYLAQPTEIGMGGAETEISKGYFLGDEASDFSFTQDLHGYDHPWPAGGGANIWGGLVMANDIATATGVTIDQQAKTVNVTKGVEKKLTGDLQFKENTQYTFILNGSCSQYANLMFTYTDGTTDRTLGKYILIGANVSAPGKTVASLCKRSYNGITVINYEQSGLFEGNISADQFSPYENICPITPGFTLTRDDESELAVYAGYLDMDTQSIVETYAEIASYDGQTLPGEWVSDRDVYASGTTPTTGAQVVYELATPATIQLTASEFERALSILGVSYGYRYTDDLRYGGDAAGTMSATIAATGHVPAAVVLRYTGAITNPRVRLVGAETGIVYGICALNESLSDGETFELSTRYEDSHVTLIEQDGTEENLLPAVNQAYEHYFRCPTTEASVLTIESDGSFEGAATLLVYNYYRSV